MLLCIGVQYSVCLFVALFMYSVLSICLMERYKKKQRLFVKCYYNTKTNLKLTGTETKQLNEVCISNYKTTIICYLFILRY